MSREVLELVYNDIPLTVEGYYIKGEEPVWRYPDGSGYPGSSPEFDIEGIYINGIEICQLLSNRVIEDISDMCLDAMED